LPAHGFLLSGGDLIRALEKPDHIFREHTWDKAGIRGAGYSVRLACDLMVIPIPEKPGEAQYRPIRSKGEKKEFRLNPGDSALISTVEKFSFDFDVSATIVDKFSLAALGLLILHGGTVHPGYGRVKDPASGTWVPKADERLYFIVANVGPYEIYLREGDEIAYLQFFEVEPDETPQEIMNLGFEHLSGLFSADHGPEDGGLFYFRGVRDLRSDVDSKLASFKSDVDSKLASFKEEVTRQVGEVQAGIGKLSSEVNATETALDRVSNTSNIIVVFGVFLISVTILGIALTSLTNLIENVPAHPGSGRLTVVVILAVLYGLSCVIGVGYIARAFPHSSGRPKRRRDKTAGAAAADTAGSPGATTRRG
jgi:deoxycytidine triphosphate deaminase